MPRSDADWTRSDDPLAFPLRWATAVADAISKQLPAGFSALVTSETHAKLISTTVTGGELPLPTHVVPAKFIDSVRVNIAAGSEVVVAVLFATPGAKAGSDAGLAFAVQAASLASRGTGVVIVDASPGAPGWATHLHSLVGVYPITKRPRNGESPVLVVHPEVKDGAERFAVSHYSTAVGGVLPVVSVPVRGAMHLKLDLEATYLEACQRSRVSE